MEQWILNLILKYQDVILEFVQKYPAAAGLIMLMGVLRVVFKPLMGFLRAFVDATPSPADNEWLKKLEASKVYQSVAWLVDYLASVKLPGYDK